MNHKRGWVQQLHIGALRNTNTRMMQLLGPDTGFDTIGDFEVAKPLAAFLDRLDADGCLPKTILYNLNPRDNELCATMIGNFQDGRCPGRSSSGAPGGSWTSWTGWRGSSMRCRPWDCSASSSAC